MPNVFPNLFKDPLKRQYERFPYPPVKRFAIPRRNQGAGLAYELGTRMAFGATGSHVGKRILVAGCGTLEALVVAGAHPLANEVVAVDWSKPSLSILKSRVRLVRLRNRLMPFRRRRIAPVRVVQADLAAFKDGPFDYIIASNVLHHAEDPAAMLAGLAALLKPEGVMRVVTYPKASRVWMRATSRWLRLNGIESDSPRILATAFKAASRLPVDHPIRSTYLSQPETTHAAGLVDAFLNARENPLSPLEWKEACARAGLELVGETQTESSRSSFLQELLPDARALDAWTRLQILDDLLELCANPVLWFRRGTTTVAMESASTGSSESISADEIIGRGKSGELFLPSPIFHELGSGLSRAADLLEGCGLRLSDALLALEREVGPRYLPPPRDSEMLPGLSITEYDAIEALGAPEPVARTTWDEVSARLGGAWRLEMTEPEMENPPALSLADQAEWISLRHGTRAARVGPLRLARG